MPSKANLASLSFERDRSTNAATAKRGLIRWHRSSTDERRRRAVLVVAVGRHHRRRRSVRRSIGQGRVRERGRRAKQEASERCSMQFRSSGTAKNTLKNNTSEARAVDFHFGSPIENSRLAPPHGGPLETVHTVESFQIFRICLKNRAWITDFGLFTCDLK